VSRRTLRWVWASLLWLAVQSAGAKEDPAVAVAVAPAPAPSEVPAALAEKIRTALQQRVPTLVVLELHGTQLPGIYEVLSPDGISYTDASAEYVLMGQLLETRTRRNLSQEHWSTFNQVDFASLPLSLAIKSTRGSGARQIAVFADPQCPYCQQLETELAKLDDLTVYTFLYPLEEVHPGATARAHQIWCAADREAAWTQWMRQHQVPAASECGDDPIEQLAALGEKLHIQTTPTIIFHSGLRAAGLPSATKFVQLLDKESGPSGSSPAESAQPATETHPAAEAHPGN
jgi:thiol:disulfide interchange protein DsbC